MSAQFSRQYPAPPAGKFNTGGIVTGTVFSTAAGCILIILLATKLTKPSIVALVAAMVIFGLASLFSFVITLADASFRDMESSLNYYGSRFDEFCDKNWSTVVVGSIAIAILAVIGIVGSLYMLSFSPIGTAYFAFPALIISLFGLVPLLSLFQD